MVRVHSALERHSFPLTPLNPQTGDFSLATDTSEFMSDSCEPHVSNSTPASALSGFVFHRGSTFLPLRQSDKSMRFTAVTLHIKNHNSELYK